MFLRDKPEELADFVHEIKNITGTFEPPDLYPTKEEAVKQAKQYFTEQRDQAMKDLDFLSKPYTTPNGTTYICPEHLLEKWHGECRASLAIAERGLELCNGT
jgi:hypothetical protein